MNRNFFGAKKFNKKKEFYKKKSKKMMVFEMNEKIVFFEKKKSGLERELNLCSIPIKFLTSLYSIQKKLLRINSYEKNKK
jgi:hypothetical protein